ncbi:exonuclease domain-containing protein [Allomuricauda sp. SCSIO 65647]|uniref:exonuclease domain-containing protein n=1 Tax=Allomuricauda sp. SCSIO 65647 TaxID=2908843 RepID=UPI001F1BC4E5|nr:exonuclease domain-containing protein [Muricauda sp. SCSIO 65647]UJH67590.1 GIY-YIG nuclease family protein [Muricauda sp. SCSIO 65647]
MYAILDIESTGGKYNEEGIIEIAIYRFDGHEVVDRFISLVNPEREIQPYVANLTGIKNKMLRTAPKFHQVAKRIVEITENTVLVAHNAQFDYRILRTEFRRLGYDFQRKTLCTVDLSKKLLPEAESHSLGKLVRSLGIAVSDRHRANGDATATLKLFKLLLAKDTDKSILKDLVRAESLGELSPRQLDMVEEMPSETGVYYLHNKEGEIIFIGKSKNIKKRVNQHFTNVGKLARALQKETKKVSYEKTGSELAALLKEYHEVKKNIPQYNKKYVYNGYSHGVYINTDAKGFLNFTAARANGQVARLSSFGSMKASKNFLVQLNEKYQLTERNSQEEHNKKVQGILKKYSTENRDLILIDRGRQTGERSVFLIKKGMFKGFTFVDLNHQINNIHILESLITPMQGDAHTTHVIESYLRKEKALKIVELNQ